MIDENNSRSVNDTPSGSRRRFLRASGAAGVLGVSGLAGCLGGLGSGGSVTINMLAWDDFDLFSDGVEEKLDITLEVTKSNSSAEMFSAWNSGEDEQYDITVPNNNYVRNFVQADLVEPVDRDIVDNWDNLYSKFHEFADDQFTDGDGNVYGVPIRFGWYGYSYDSREIPEDHNQSYSQLFNEEYEGQIIMYDNHFKAMSMVALLEGYRDAFEGARVTLSQEGIDQVKEKMIDQKDLLQGYIGPDSTFIQSFTQGNFSIGQSGRNEIIDMQRDGNDWARMASPEEGEMAWFEGAVVSSKSDNKDVAWEVINEYIDQEWGAQFADAASTPSCNPQTVEELDSELQEMFGFGPERLDGMIPFKPVENEDAWISAWEEIKSA
ncbi:MAG: PotD/PotF family extracellular solute-binding protein [Haloarculaceae archaeon]